MTEPTHQGLPVSGYRPQSPAAVETVNASKELEEHVLRLVDEIGDDAELAADKRWLAIGRTQIELGFMAVNRAVFKPGRVAIADLDEPLEPAAPKGGWILERNDRSGEEPMFYCPCQLGSQWTPLEADALTFAREQDARAYIETLPNPRDVRAVEIVWS